MADGFSNAAKLVGEAIVKPVTDEVGKMVETGVQSVTAKQPADDTQKKQNQNLPNRQQLAQDDAKKKQNIMQFLQNYKQQESTLKQQRQQETHQKEQVEVQKKQEIKQFEFAKKQQRQTMQQAELMRAKSKSERKGGAG